ncbi:MAG: prepilin-type N-terminal cleavage/methylation domain-containing protein [Acidobacteria bacterium]|nr:prepilin-type N-terminal cleavage/methylation domain-containing protein [Acidobacteriota bacterium]MDW7984654.1 prepilin-type N-terminal cleavage/methylation domain-containing protein [Acidobacteriota bacterium]
MGRRGFTTLELLVVLALMSLFLLAAMPALVRFYQTYQLRTAASQMQIHMRLARYLAVKQKTPYRVLIFPETDGTSPNSYVVERLDGGGWTPLPAYRFSFAGEGVRILEGSVVEVRFDTFGGATAVGGSGAGRIFLQGRHRSAEIVIGRVGAVEILER